MVGVGISLRALVGLQVRPEFEGAHVLETAGVLVGTKGILPSLA